MCEKGKEKLMMMRLMMMMYQNAGGPIARHPILYFHGMIYLTISPVCACFLTMLPVGVCSGLMYETIIVLESIFPRILFLTSLRCLVNIFMEK